MESVHGESLVGTPTFRFTINSDNSVIHGEGFSSVVEAIINCKLAEEGLKGSLGETSDKEQEAWQAGIDAGREIEKNNAYHASREGFEEAYILANKYPSLVKRTDQPSDVIYKFEADTNLGLFEAYYPNLKLANQVMDVTQELFEMLGTTNTTITPIIGAKLTENFSVYNGGEPRTEASADDFYKSLGL